MRNLSTNLGVPRISDAVVGAGGWMTGHEFAADGTNMGRCDTAMPLVLAPNGTVWVKQFRPGIDVLVSDLDFTLSDPSTYAAAIAWSNSAIRYVATMGWVWVKKSGATYYTKTAVARSSTYENGNTNYRMSNQPLAVCPTDPSICLFAAPGGLMRLTSYGDTVTAISTGSVPAQTASGLNSVAWDRSTAGRCYALIQGVGVYKSTDYGATWTVMTGAPLGGGCLKVSPFTGAILIAGDTQEGDVAVYRFNGTGWSVRQDTNLANAATHSVCFSPNTSGLAYAMAIGGQLRTSTDDGVTWTPAMSTSAGTQVNDSVDVPWQVADTGFRSVGNAEVSPLGDILHVSTGVGHWKLISPPKTGSYNTITHWTGISRGIENMVAVGARYAPDGASAIWMQDKQSMHWGPNEVGRVLPAVYGPYPGIYRGQNVGIAPEDSNFRVTTTYTNDIAYTTDKGKTWTACPSLRTISGSINGGGQVAVLSKDVWIVGQSSETPYNSTTRAKNTLYITRDRGSTWTELLIGNGNAINAMMPNFSGSARKIFAVDNFYTASGLLKRVYFYNAGDTDNTTNADNIACKGLWRIDVPVSGTPTATRIAGRPVSGNQDIIHNKLVVLGAAGKLAFVGGDGMPFAFRGSDDGSFTWTEFGGTDDQSAGTKFAEVYGVDYGKAAYGSSFPTIYMVGFRDTGNNHATGTTAQLLRYGCWASYDDGVTWKRTATFPGGAPIRAQDLAASPVTFGEVIVTLGGMGAAVITDEYFLRAA